MDGVGESFSSGISELSIVRETSEYTLSPIRMPSLVVAAVLLLLDAAGTGAVVAIVASIEVRNASPGHRKIQKNELARVRAEA